MRCVTLLCRERRDRERDRERDRDRDRDRYDDHGRDRQVMGADVERTLCAADEATSSYPAGHT